jgi:ABC-2 type transport system permease protein
VNWQHVRAFVWLRWRMTVNQWRRAGAFNAVLLTIITFLLLLTVVPLFIGSFLLGLYVIPRAAPVHLMYAWDGLIVAFLFVWGIGLITELQRTEPLSLSKFLHLPVSVNGAFLINYLSSLFRLSLILFAPVMLAYALALIYVKGWPLLPVLPALLAFLMMVTALTYQLQGWLAALMSNPRRRRTVIVVATMTFILIVQLPNLMNYFAMGGMERATRQRLDRSKALADEMEKLNRAAQSRKIDAQEVMRRQQDLLKEVELHKQETDRMTARWEHTARLANEIIPFGWLPMGVVSAAEGRILPSILGLLGMTLIGTVSLWRAYRTTVGLYLGQTSNRKERPAPAAAMTSPSTARTAGGLLLEAHLPGVSEPVSAIALAGLRALIRSPEAKMMLLTPLIMVPIFGSGVFRARHNMPELMRPLVGIGAMGVVLLGMIQLMGNQFGFDRDGFRVFVLCAASRRDILLGKNLAFAPVALGMAAILLAVVQGVCPMRLDHFVAMFPQYVSMFLLFCLVTNLLSIYAPFPIAAGSLKPTNPKTSTVLLQMVMTLILLPLTQGPTLLPLGIEALLRRLGWPAAAPICLVLSLVECAVVVLVYLLSMELLGNLFQAREQAILETVTKRVP